MRSVVNCYFCGISTFTTDDTTEGGESKPSSKGEPGPTVSSSAAHHDITEIAMGVMALLRNDKKKALQQVKQLIKSNKDLAYTVLTADVEGWTPVHACALRGNKKLLKTMLQAGISVNCIMGRPDGLPARCTLLHVAANRTDKKILNYLLHHGADVHAKDSDGNTALHYATHAENKDSVRLLLDCGATMGDSSGGGGHHNPQRQQHNGNGASGHHHHRQHHHHHHQQQQETPVQHSSSTTSKSKATHHRDRSQERHLHTKPQPQQQQEAQQDTDQPVLRHRQQSHLQPQKSKQATRPTSLTTTAAYSTRGRTSSKLLAAPAAKTFSSSPCLNTTSPSASGGKTTPTSSKHHMSNSSNNLALHHNNNNNNNHTSDMNSNGCARGAGKNSHSRCALRAGKFFIRVEPPDSSPKT